MHNPYEPPRAELIDRKRPPGSITKAVAVGFAIDFGGTAFVQFVAVVIYAAVLTSQGEAARQIQETIVSAVPWSGFGLIAALLGSFMSFLAGYQAAAVANRKNYLAPGIVSAISAAIGAYAGGSRYPVWVVLVLSGLTVAVTLAGAWLCMLNVARRE